MLKMLISAPFVGFIGGAERYIMSVCNVFPDAEIDVVWSIGASRGDFYPRGENVTVFSMDTCVKHELYKKKTYDIFIQVTPFGYYTGGSIFSVRKRIILPAGYDVSDIEDQFDYVVMEGRDGDRYIGDEQKKTIMLPPPILATIPERRVAVEGVPENYFLTLFNPFSLDRDYSDGLKPTKGFDVLYDTAPSARFPIVWGYSDQTPHPLEENVRKVENVVIRKNLMQEQMAWLYENCRGYICFSREEGFGNAIADAMYYNIPIFSRRIGVVTFFDESTYGLNIYETAGELVSQLNGRDVDRERIAYDISFLSPEIFRRTILEIAAE